jgi:hypothetical protein
MDQFPQLYHANCPPRIPYLRRIGARFRRLAAAKPVHVGYINAIMPVQFVTPYFYFFPAVGPSHPACRSFQ